MQIDHYDYAERMIDAIDLSQNANLIDYNSTDHFIKLKFSNESMALITYDGFVVLWTTEDVMTGPYNEVIKRLFDEM